MFSGLNDALDFAVSTKGQVIFYDGEWNQIVTAAHRFDELSAIAYNQLDDVLYFSDQNHNNGTIFSLKLSSTEDYHVEKVVQRTGDEVVQGLAFDSLEQILYWTDARNGTIYQLNVGAGETQPTVFMDLKSKQPYGIAVDVCRRKLYWTNAHSDHPSIERVSLDGTKHEVLIEGGMFAPLGIAVDQYTQRIFWVDDLEGEHFKVESAALDGTDRKEIHREMFHSPLNLAVDETSVFWSDTQGNAIWQYPKNSSESVSPVRVKSFTTAPKAIIARVNLTELLSQSSECKTALNIIKSDITSTSRQQRNEDQSYQHSCLNGGTFDFISGTCVCPMDFVGAHCETSVCHNYCVRGKCQLSTTKLPECKCFAGYTGERCEVDKCHGFCLNGGHCDLEEGEPVCKCDSTYRGRHCELIDRENVCSSYCSNEGFMLDGVDLNAMCNKCVIFARFLL